MKILLVATVQSHICQFHKPLFQMLRELGDVEIHVAARNNLAEKNGLKLDMADRVFDIPFERSPFRPQNIRAFLQLKKLIAQGHYDVVHCNTPVGGLLARLAAVGARRRGTKVVYTAHGFHFYKGAPKSGWLLYYPLEKIFSRLTDVLITINHEDALLAQKRFHCKTARIHGVGVDETRYHPCDAAEKARLQEELGVKSPAVLCVGELLPNKNQAMAIRALRRVVSELSDVTLLIAGNGPEQENLERLTETLGLQNNVRFLGYCTHLEDYQRAVELSVSCSIREGLGLNLIEAMLSGNPIVATENRGHSELIDDGENGFLVRQGDDEALAQSIAELLKNPARAASFAERGRQIAAKYTASVVHDELKTIYESLLS